MRKERIQQLADSIVHQFNTRTIDLPARSLEIAAMIHTALAEELERMKCGHLKTELAERRKGDKGAWIDALNTNVSDRRQHDLGGCCVGCEREDKKYRQGAIGAYSIANKVAEKREAQVRREALEEAAHVAGVYSSNDPHVRHAHDLIVATIRSLIGGKPFRAQIEPLTEKEQRDLEDYGPELAGDA